MKAPNEVQKSLRDFGIESVEPGYRIKHSNKSEDFLLIEAEGENTRALSLLLYKNSDPELITRRFSEKTVKLKSIFEGSRDSYFAVLTKQIKCDPKFLPEYKSVAGPAKETFSIRAFANERNSIGACDDGTVKRKILLVLLKCKHSLAEFQFSVPLNEELDQFTPYVNSLQCLL